MKITKSSQGPRIALSPVYTIEILGGIVFSERNIVDKFHHWTKDCGGIHDIYPRDIANFGTWKIFREFKFPDSTRCDILIESPHKRISLIVEAKIHVTTQAILQLHSYMIKYQEITSPKPYLEERITRCCLGYLLGQYFSEEVLRLASMLFIPCIHFTPLNQSDWEFNNLFSLDGLNNQLKWGRSRDFYDIYGISQRGDVNGKAIY